MLQIHLKNSCVSVVCMFVALKFTQGLIRMVLGDEAFRKFCHEGRALMNKTRFPVKEPLDIPLPSYLSCEGT